MKTLAFMLAAAAMLGACSERPQTVGDYRGKKDAKPYEANFGGDKAKWEAALRARNQNQNEYKRAE
ncbi:MAG: hypothetical protein KF778_03025 [Rhodocyclaceae bacterium]|nr:hypothetical protein [Rhodocyclaceae bacterium]MBX3667350.1 hypothetical protein [Rhodocyclaceae bacterium]